MKITDRIYYLDNTHKFHNDCESFFDNSKQKNYVCIRETCEIVQGKLSFVSYVKESSQKHETWLNIFGKVMLSLLVLPVIIFGIGLLINRSKQLYEPLPNMPFKAENLKKAVLLPPPLKLNVKSSVSSISAPPSTPQSKQLDRESLSFLASEGFSAEGSIDDIHHVTMGEVQSTASTREKAVQLFAKKRDAFSLKSLRELEFLNPELVQTLRIKRIGHAFNLKGSIPVKKKNVFLEGFSEVYTVPMLFSTLESFFQKRGNRYENIFDADELRSILESFGQTLFFTDRSKSKEIVDQINRKENVVVPFCTGWDWHVTFGAFVGNNFIYCNRGQGFYLNHGIKIHSMPENFQMTVKTMDQLLNRYGLKDKDQLKEKEFCSNNGFQFVRYKKMESQEVGNCSYANAKALIYFLMAYAWLKKEKHPMTSDNWNLAFFAVEGVFKDFVSFDRGEILRDFTIDLKSPPTSITKELVEHFFMRQVGKKFLIRMPLPEDRTMLAEADKLMARHMV